MAPNTQWPHFSQDSELTLALNILYIQIYLEESPLTQKYMTSPYSPILLSYASAPNPLESSFTESQTLPFALPLNIL